LSEGVFPMSRKNPDSPTGPPILEAAENAERLIRGLQTRLARRAGEAPAEEPTENLEWELERYFEAEMSQHLAPLSPLQQIRKRVVEGVAEKVLNGWERSRDATGGSLENEVIERLVERVFERLTQTQGDLLEQANRALPAPEQ
jgi:hypothetical protein